VKLIIQIPCHNEESQLPDTLAALPRKVAGFDHVEWLVIDDGSIDGTAAVAAAAGADHVIRLGHNRGLAGAFMAGIEASLKRGADVIVNTDADNQYRADGIPAIVAPILAGQAQLVVGARPIDQIDHFSPVKRWLQKFGSWVVRKVSGTAIRDAPSGFRAIQRDAAVQLYVFNAYTYTIETIIQAGRLGIPVLSVPVAVNPPTRESRLIRSEVGYVLRSAATILRVLVVYRPLQVFTTAALFTALPGVAAFARFLWLYAQGQGDGSIQSLVIGAALIAAGFVLFVGGVLADLVAANRMLLAEIRARLLLAEINRRPPE
jgi:glycosyltransferase involved in cell wall biosynthesis